MLDKIIVFFFHIIMEAYNGSTWIQGGKLNDL